MPCHQLFGVSVCRVASRDWGHIPCLLANTCFPRYGSENGPRPYFARMSILHTRHVSSKIVPVSWVFPIFPRHLEYKSDLLFFCFLAPYSCHNTLPYARPLSNFAPVSKIYWRDPLPSLVSSPPPRSGFGGQSFTHKDHGVQERETAKPRPSFKPPPTLC